MKKNNLRKFSPKELDIKKLSEIVGGSDTRTTAFSFTMRTIRKETIQAAHVEVEVSIENETEIII